MWLELARRPAGATWTASGPITPCRRPIATATTTAAPTNNTHVPVVLTTEEERAIYGTAEEAQRERPARRPKWRLFTITDPTGNARYTWAPHKEVALYRVAVADGY